MPGGRNGSGSHICLRAGFVLKRFIIFLTGRFPGSVLVNNCCQLNLHKICIVGTGMGGKQHARISPEPTDGSCCRGGAPWWLGDVALYHCSPWEPSRDGAAEPPEMGILAGLSLKRGLSLYGAKFATGGGNRVGSVPVAPLTSQEAACPSRAPTCPLTLWMGVPRVGSQGSGHRPDPGHPTAASRRFIFKKQLPLFLPFHLFPSAAGTPSVSAGQQSIASEFHPDPTPSPAPGTAWK